MVGQVSLYSLYQPTYLTVGLRLLQKHLVLIAVVNVKQSSSLYVYKRPPHLLWDGGVMGPCSQSLFLVRQNFQSMVHYFIDCLLLQCTSLDLEASALKPS